MVKYIRIITIIFFVSSCKESTKSTCHINIEGKTIQIGENLREIRNKLNIYPILITEETNDYRLTKDIEYPHIRMLINSSFYFSKDNKLDSLRISINTSDVGENLLIINDKHKTFQDYYKFLNALESSNNCIYSISKIKDSTDSYRGVNYLWK